MKKFLIKLSFVLLLIGIADYIFGRIVDALYLNIPTKQSYALTKCKDDIVILGSSRAENGIIPSIITDSTGMSCYNLSVGGQNIYYYYGILSSILTHHTPKVIIMDMTHIDYNNTIGHNTENLSALNPLYSHVDSVNRLIRSVDYLNKYRFISKTYQFNSTLFSLIAANIVESNHKTDFVNGYMPISKIYNKMLSRHNSNKYKIDNDKLNIIIKIENICHKKNIKLVLLLSPQFLILDKVDQNIFHFEKKISDCGYNIWNYSQDTSIINYNNLFADPAHLNKFGAKKYSHMLAHRLKVEL